MLRNNIELMQECQKCLEQLASSLQERLRMTTDNKQFEQLHKEYKNALLEVLNEKQEVEQSLKALNGTAEKDQKPSKPKSPPASPTPAKKARQR